MTNPRMYYRPKTLAEAIERAAQPGAVALAGGALTLGGVILPYESVVDLQDLVDLKPIEMQNDGLHIGGTAVLQAVVNSPLIPDVLKSALTRTIPINLRNNASVGESLISSDPPREWLAALLAVDAQVEHAGHLASPVPSSLWEQPLEEFVQYLHLHRHGYQGIITQVRIPLNTQLVVGTAVVSRTPADQPIVNAAVSVSLDKHGRVSSAIAAVGGVSQVPVIRLKLDSLLAQILNITNVGDAAKTIPSRVHPVGDDLGSVEYRMEMARVTVQRALMECLRQISV